jgi:light-regulated signal transduction histidine kinase (bacteriophytochrome)
MEGRLNDNEQRRFAVIRDNVQKMGELIDDLLAFSRLGRQQANKVVLDVESLIREVWEELAAINPHQQASLQIGPMPAALGDRTLIRQVYSNLLGNAVKFTRAGIPVLIEAGCMDSDNGTIYYIRDNGIGFDMKFHDKIFGVFQRLHSADEYEGTGIGLALVSRIINGHGGRVWAESKPGEGATFFFTLPSQS